MSFSNVLPHAAVKAGKASLTLESLGTDSLLEPRTLQELQKIKDSSSTQKLKSLRACVNDHPAGWRTAAEEEEEVLPCYLRSIQCCDRAQRRDTPYHSVCVCVQSGHTSRPVVIRGLSRIFGRLIVCEVAARSWKQEFTGGNLQLLMTLQGCDKTSLWSHACVCTCTDDECALYPDRSSSLGNRLIPLSIDQLLLCSSPSLPTNPSRLHHPSAHDSSSPFLLCLLIFHLQFLLPRPLFLRLFSHFPSIPQSSPKSQCWWSCRKKIPQRKSIKRLNVEAALWTTLLQMWGFLH